jgi:hypothetical protein
VDEGVRDRLREELVGADDEHPMREHHHELVHP